jgi:hypothetical protein
MALMTVAPSAAQAPLPGGSDTYPVQCSLPLRLPALAFLAKLRLELQPTDDQRAAFDEFETAFNKAVDEVTAICSIGTLTAPTERLQTALKQIASSLQAIQALQAPASALYAKLTDEQKSRLGSFDRWFDAAAALLSDGALNSKVPPRTESRPDAKRPGERLCIEDRCYDLAPPNADGRREYRWRDQEYLGRLWRE